MSPFAFLSRLWSNWVTLLGSTITTISGFAIIVLLAIEFVGSGSNSYASALLSLALPGVFALGLALILIGLWKQRRLRQRHAAGAAPHDALAAAFDAAFQDRSARLRVLFVAVITLLSVALFGLAGTHAVTYMGSPQFCGTTCHTVMQPEWEAYNRSNHSRVTCVQCHVGPGASWGLKAKFNGLHQLWAVMRGSHPRPVPAPVANLRSNRDTCEQCHTGTRFTGGRVKLFPHYKTDQANTPSFNVQLLRVGGQNPKSMKYEGSHWHASSAAEVRFEYRDPARTRIGRITVVAPGQPPRVYEAPGAAEPALGERTMECVDCHNRPTHVFEPSARAAIDRALWEGRLDAKLPWIAEVGAALLARQEVPRDGAAAWFGKAIVEAYAGKADPKPEPVALARAADELAKIWSHNNFPAMKVGWGTYPSHLGHDVEGTTRGCYRCHDKQHVARLADGSTKTLSQSCDLCHEALATEKHPDEFDGALQSLLPLE